MASNPYDIDIRQGNYYGSSGSTTATKPGNKKKPYDVSISTGDASNQDYSKPTKSAAQSKSQAQTDQKKPSLWDRAKGMAKGVVDDAKNTANKSLNTVEAGVAGVTGLATAGVQAAKGNKTGAKQTIAGANQEVSDLLDKGHGGQGGFLTSKQAKSSGGGAKGLKEDFIKPTVKATAEIAPYVLPGGAGKGASLLTKVASGAAANAGIAGATDAVSQAVDKGKVNWWEVGRQSATAGAIGGLVPVGGAAARKGITAAADTSARDLLRNTRNSTLLERAKQADTGTAPGSVIEPTAEHPATATVQQHLNENYKPSSDHPDEAFAADYLKNNTSQALHDYEARTKEIFGSSNIVGGDDAKYSIPGMGPQKSVTYHEPASTLAKGYYQHLLADPQTVDKPVLITAGGTGAGKTSALKKAFNDEGVSPHDYAAIVDTNLTTVKSATDRIEPALATGRPVAIQFVYRDPVEAFQNGVIPRATKEGRAVTAATHADTHASSLDTIKQLADKYKENPNVDIQVIDNSRGAGKSQTVTLDFLHDKSYTKSEIEANIHDLLDNHLKEGKLTDEQHQTFKGQAPNDQATNGVGEAGSNISGVEQAPIAENGVQPEQPSSPAVDTADVVQSPSGDQAAIDWFLPKLPEETAVATPEARTSALESVSKDVTDKVYTNPDYIDAVSKGGIAVHEINGQRVALGNSEVLSQFKRQLQENEGVTALQPVVVDRSGGAPRLSPEIGSGGALQKEAVKYADQAVPTPVETPKTAKSSEKPVQAAESTKPKSGTSTKNESKEPAATAKPASDKPKTLTPTQTAHMESINGYTHSTHMEKDYADMLRERESGLRGGQIIKNPDGTYRRTTEHSRFYSDFYKENKKAPTRADWLEEAQRQLASGKAELGASGDWKSLVEREHRDIPAMKLDLPKNTDELAPTKVSKLAKGIEAKAIKEKLTRSFGDLPEYSKVNMKDQAEKATKLIAEDEQKANRIALGREQPPAGLLPESVLVAVENKAIADGNIDLLRELAHGDRVGEASVMGQRIRTLAERDPESLVGAIQKVSEARKAALERRIGQSAEKAVAAEVRQIRSAKPKVTKETFASFVDSLKC
jgi:hypothetical protein